MPMRGEGIAFRSGKRELSVHLDAPVPEEVAVGRGTAVLVCGWCFAADAAIRSLGFVLDGETQPVLAFGMPRLDPLRELHPGLDPYSLPDRDAASAEDPELRSYRSGFWGLVSIPPELVAGPGQRAVQLSLRAGLDGGAVTEAPLASIRLMRSNPAAAVPAPGARPGGPLVAICMATHNPPPDLLVGQIESIRDQTHGNWICVISDDASSARALEALQAAVAGDERFVVSRSPRRLGFYGNFERALSMAPVEADFVAMADQDDRWHPQKLERLVAGIGPAQLVYSDARIVARDGELISDTYWSTRRNNHTSMLSLLVANSVTGAAALFRRGVLDYALPFPPGQFAHYHDHWIALTALALGDIRFLGEPLYDYVQHGSASLGHATANLMPSLSDRIAGLRTRSPRERIRKWRMHYFVDILRLEQVATVLEMRCGGRMTAAKRRDLRALGRGEPPTVALTRLSARGVRELVGRPETLGAEWMLLLALVWRKLLGLTARDRPSRRLRIDAVPPADLAPGPARTASPAGSGVRAIEEKIAPLPFQVSEDAPRRVNLLIPTVDLDHLFAGYIAKFNLAVRLASRGVRVRIVTTDPTPRLPGGWASRLESYAGLSGLTERVEFAFGRESTGLEVSARDAFIATTWWTAHVAHRALEELGGAAFLYLIQEYEPFTFAMGTYAALAQSSYELSHSALFSTELLRDWFRRQAIGVYAEGEARGDAVSASFQNAITPVIPQPREEIAARRPRRLLFYARPEPHAARNMFELGVLGLSRAIEDGAFARGWELHGIGGVDATARRVVLSGGVGLELLPRTSQSEYARLLREHDVGLALMYTPHPSLVPIEMSAAGMLTVTNTFENKTREALAEISSNLVAAPPTLEGVAEALCHAARAVEDVERRRQGSAVAWSRDWSESFPDELMARVERFLRLAPG
jgi:hypothetical protein